MEVMLGDTCVSFLTSSLSLSWWLQMTFLFLPLSLCVMLLLIWINEISSEFALIRGWTLVLYGTAISPQKDDEPRQSSPSTPVLEYNNQNYSLQTFYRPNTSNYGTTNLYVNRKQQQQQQKSTTVPGQTTAAGRKNGKQKNGKGNKNNNNNGNQRTSTTPKPIYTTVMLNQFSSNAKLAKNKSKLSQGSSSASFGRHTSTMRPRTTTANTKSYLNPDGGGKNHLLSSSKGDKLQPANSNIYEKSPGKAPKQVKSESSYTTHPPTDARSTSHQSMSMSKMFERYEKIERIYPELKPYKDNPAYFTVTNGNGKPSRENSKSFSSFVSVNSMPQKKNSEISTVARQQVSQASAANEKSGKGTNQFILFRNYMLLLFSSSVVILYWYSVWIFNSQGHNCSLAKESFLLRAT